MVEPVDYLRTLRAHQWVKNALVFVAPAAAHAVDPVSYVWAAGAFVVLSLVASSGYVLNDILDVDHDREHPSKRYRPLAAGKVRVVPMAAVGSTLAAVGVAASFLMSFGMGACVVLYLVLVVAYSLRLKRAIIIDVIVLASLYVIRVVAGGVAVAIPVSPLAAGVLPVHIRVARNRQAADGTGQRGRASSRGRVGPRLHREGCECGDNVGGSQRYRRRDRARAVCPKPRGGDALRTTGTPLAGMPCAPLLARSVAPARQPGCRGRRSGDVRSSRQDKLAGRFACGRNRGRRDLTAHVASVCLHPAMAHWRA